MKRFLFFILCIAIIYTAKPLWEDPVSKYVDISFLEPVDETIDSVLTSDIFKNAIHSLGETLDKAVLFLSSKTEETATVPDEVEKPELTNPAHSNFAVHNIEIGASEDVVTSVLGQPNRRTLNEYGTEWLTFHEDYRNFVMVSFDGHRKVNAIYTNDDLITSDFGIKYGTAKSVVQEKLGKPVKEIRKGMNLFVLQESDGFDLFEVGDLYAYVFYDLHQGETVTAMQLVSTSLEKQKTGIYAGGDAALRSGFEQQLFDLTNAARVRHGASILEWDGAVSGTARKHSADMAIQDYFSHDNKEGKSPFDRMKDDGIRFQGAGENLAYGQSSSIFAHEGLMNSPGHRENILLDTYSHLGTGVAFNEKSQPYYTENFLLK